MEITKSELLAVLEVAESKLDRSVRELAEIELCLVGGGQGDITLG